jgi:hypothetical protein
MEIGDRCAPPVHNPTPDGSRRQCGPSAAAGLAIAGDIALVDDAAFHKVLLRNTHREMNATIDIHFGAGVLFQP